MRSGIVAVLGAFALNGAVFGSWAPRVPALAEQIGAAEGSLGLSLLGGSIGMILAASLTGQLCAVFGARVVVAASSLAGCVVMPLLGLAPSPLLLGAALAALGLTVGALDVAMNIAGVTVVRKTGRPLMPTFHAAFSIGALVGSGGAAVAAASHTSPLRHFLFVSAVGVVITVAIARWVPVEDLLRQPVDRGPAGRPPAKRPVLWLLGCVALCSSIAEGASADWSAFFGVHQRQLTETAGALVYSAFSISMAVARLLGERIESRWGPQRMLVGGATIGGLGLFLAVAVPSSAFTFIGFALAGAGLAYAFPITLEMGGAVGRRADGGGGERELAFVTMIAYSGFLLGPPMVGGIAELTTLSVALGVVGGIAVLMGPLALAAAAARRRELAAGAEVHAGAEPAQSAAAQAHGTGDPGRRP